MTTMMTMRRMSIILFGGESPHLDLDLDLDDDNDDEEDEYDDDDDEEEDVSPHLDLDLDLDRSSSSVDRKEALLKNQIVVMIWNWLKITLSS